jgi:hypothetical protein
MIPEVFIAGMIVGAAVAMLCLMFVEWRMTENNTPD